MAEQDYTIDEVARRLNTHRKTVERLIASGKLKAYKVGRIYRIMPMSLEEFQQQHKVKPFEKVAC